MSEPALETFSAALAAHPSKRHLLLGNGFSMSWNRDLFSYGSLLNKADFSSLSKYASKAFESLDTADFEIVMRRLQESATLGELYSDGSTPHSSCMRDDAEGLRDVLAKTLAGHHPDRPSDVPAHAYRACRQFLAHFVKGKIYTLNYDLLLYWTLMQDDASFPPVPSDDGFREADAADGWVVWDSTAAPSQSVYYLHGALHLFDAGYELQKFTWSRTGLPLVEQIRSAMALDPPMFPLFVAEDSGRNKRKRIQHSSYLHKGLRSLTEIGGSLFTFGFGFGESDLHISDAIVAGKTSSLWIGVHGGTAGSSFPHLLSVGRDLEHRRAQKNPRRALRVRFFETESVNVWGHMAT